MKTTFLTYGLFLSIFCISQTSFHLNTNVGLNRIGLLYDLSGQMTLKNHVTQLGLRFYGPDQVFVKDFPGIILGYNYRFCADKKWSGLVGINASFFREQKGEIQFTLVDPKMALGVNWNWAKRFSSHAITGIGYTFSSSSGGIVASKSNFSYLNYEFKIGISYRISRLVN